MKIASKFAVLRLPLIVLGLLVGIYANYILLAPPRMTTDDALILDAAEANLTQLVYQTRDNSSNFFREAKAEVEKEGNRPNSVAFLEKMMRLREETSTVIESIGKAQETAQERKYKAWARKDSSTWRNGFEIESDKLYTLYHTLARYDSLLASIDTTARQALIKNQISLLTANMENQALEKEAFKNYYFRTTESVGLYNLARMKTEVAYREYIAMKAMLDRLKRINLVDLRFDRFQLFATAESEVVEEGQSYKATVFFASFFKGSHIPLRMRSSEGTVVVQDGIGKVSFKASADKFDANGLAKKSWKGSITLKTTRGTDTTFSVETEYFVRKKQ